MLELVPFSVPPVTVYHRIDRSGHGLHLKAACDWHNTETELLDELPHVIVRH